MWWKFTRIYQLRLFLFLNMCYSLLRDLLLIRFLGCLLTNLRFLWLRSNISMNGLFKLIIDSLFDFSLLSNVIFFLFIRWYFLFYYIIYIFNNFIFFIPLFYLIWIRLLIIINLFLNNLFLFLILICLIYQNNLWIIILR